LKPESNWAQLDQFDPTRQLPCGHPEALGLKSTSLPLTRLLDTFQATNTTVDIAEFKDRFSEMLTLVEQGGQVIVCRRNVPLARIEAIRKPVVRPPKASVVGCMKGSVRIHADLAEPYIPDSQYPHITSID
jgi:antitoxin (DNA-binding transcriptional repressor) of toxin-antitoxin stability system